jgi:Suppressor of fused protein (SUFU)
MLKARCGGVNRSCAVAGSPTAQRIGTITNQQLLGVLPLSFKESSLPIHRFRPVNDNSNVLLAATSPFGNIEAVVESDGRTVYLYLDGGPNFGIRAVWVRNLVTGPLTFNNEDLQGSRAPVLPRIHTAKSEPSPLPVADDLSLVWFVEGNAVALFERERLLAVIPPWSGLDGFHGYSVECASENQVVAPLPNDANFLRRIEISRRYWQEWTNNSPFTRWQPEFLARYAAAYGQQQNYFNINGENFPPRGLGVFKSNRAVTLATVGMSLCLMPTVELVAQNPWEFRRVELVNVLPVSATEVEIMTVAKRMSSLAGLPWREWTWLGDNHTCQWMPQGNYPYAGLYRIQDPADVGYCSLPEIGDDPVNPLGIIPLSNVDYQWLGTNQKIVAQLARDGRLPS